jgi:hypothetical protein
MDPAVDLPILPPFKERARTPRFPIGMNPVIDPVYLGQVSRHKAFGSAIYPVRKTDKNMGKDVPPFISNPWYKVIDDPFLVPSPFLATLPALPAVLSHGMDHTHSPEDCGGHPVRFFFLMAGYLQKKTIPLHFRKMLGPGVRENGLCGKPEGMTGHQTVSCSKEDSPGFIKKRSCFL